MIFIKTVEKNVVCPRLLPPRKTAAKVRVFSFSIFQIITIFAADFNTHTFIPHTFYQTNPPYRQRMRCLNNIAHALSQQYKKL